VQPCTSVSFPTKCGVEAGAGVAAGPAGTATHAEPSKHFPGPQSHVFTWWLFAGAQPHAPIKQVFGKSPELAQQEEVVTFPSDEVHAYSAAAGPD